MGRDSAVKVVTARALWKEAVSGADQAAAVGLPVRSWRHAPAYEKRPLDLEGARAARATAAGTELAWPGGPLVLRHVITTRFDPGCAHRAGPGREGRRTLRRGVPAARAADDHPQGAQPGAAQRVRVQGNVAGRITGLRCRVRTVLWSRPVRTELTYATRNPVRAALVASLETQLAQTRVELSEQYKIQSSNAQRLLALTDNLREAEERGREERDELRRLRHEVEGLRERARWHKEVVAEKEKQLLVSSGVLRGACPRELMTAHAPPDPAGRPCIARAGAVASNNTEREPQDRQFVLAAALARNEERGALAPRSCWQPRPQARPADLGPHRSRKQHG